MGTLVMMHFPTNTGYALGALEPLFHRSALAGHIRRLLEDDALRQRYREASRRLAEERYSEDRQVHELAAALAAGG